MRLYLCGSVAGRSTKETREERQAAASAIRARGWAAADPISGEYEALKRKRKIDDADSGLSLTCIAAKDIFQIKSCDVLLWLTAGVPSFGSCIEVGIAYANGRAIIAIDPTKHGRKSAFVAHCCTYIADNLDEALDFVSDYLAIDDPVLEVARAVHHASS